MRFDFAWELRKTLRNQLRFADGQGVLRTSASPVRILLPQIETSHYQFYQMLILAKALQLRGAEVRVLLCGSCLDGCEIKSVRNAAVKDPCLSCRFHHRYVVPMYGLDVIQLSDLISKEEVKALKERAAAVAEEYPDRYLYKGIDIIPIVNDSVVRFYYGAVPLNADLLAAVRKRHLVTSMIGIEAAERIDETFSPDTILNNMFVYSVAEPYYKYFSRKGGIRLFSVSISPVDYHSVILNIFEHYRSQERYLRYVAARKKRRLNGEEELALKNLLRTRMEGNIDMFRDFQYFEVKRGVKEILHIDESKRNVFLFSNVYWDLAAAESGQLFGDVITWVLRTIEVLKGRDDIRLFIKPHPGEQFNSPSSLKSVVDFIHERYIQLPPNVTLILPEMKIKPYDLFPYIDLGLVYSGTLGLEMLLCDIPVAILGKAPYSCLGFAHEPETSQEYTKIMVGDVPPVRPDRSEVELFAYYYFIKNFIPWNLTERAYADNFKGYTFNSLEDILPGKNKYIDHICNCILDSKNTVIEGWE